MGSTEAEARAEELLIKASVRNGTWGLDLRSVGVLSQPAVGFPPPAPASLSLADAFRRVFAERWRHQKDKEVRSRIKAITSFFGADKPIDKIDHASVQALIAHLLGGGSKPSTVNRYLATLRTMLRMACDDWGILDRIPKIRSFRELPGRLRTVSAAEERMLCKAAKEGWGYVPVVADLVPLLMDTGMRLGEALALKYEDVDFGERLIHIWKQKGVKARSIPMTKRVLSILRRRRNSTGLVFGGLEDYRAERAFRWAKKKAGITDPTLRYHALRHTTASRLVQRGVSLYTVQRLLGHSTIKVTERYAHLAPENLTAAVRLLEEPKRATSRGARAGAP